ncbi:hypothetical protein F6455_10565 [Proteobacteria bacterium 005FR1]|nr:hypothetical protein [Proteobacteria bacterium 005FR1]
MKFLKKLLRKNKQREVTASESVEIPGAEQKTLLICQRCSGTFVDQVDPRLTGDAASLPAALKAHRAGWIVADGEILCPACGGKQGQKLH